MRAGRAFDLRQATPALALRPAAGIVVGLMAGLLAGVPPVAVQLAAGAIPVAVTAAVDRYRAGPRILLGAAVATALACSAGSVTSQVGWLHLVVGAIAAGGAGLCATGGTVPAAAALQVLIGFVVFGRFPLPWTGALAAGAAVLAGGLLQVLLVTPGRASGRVRTARVEVAAAAKAVADLLCAADRPGVSTPLVRRAARARDAIARVPRARAEPWWNTLVDAALDSRVPALAVLASRPRLNEADLAAIDDVRRSAAAWWLEAASAVCEGATHVTGPSGAPQWSAGSAVDPVVAGAMSALTDQARQVAVAPRAATPVVDGLLASWSRWRRPSSAVFRYALRLALVVPLALSVGEHLDPGRGYWVALTVVVVLRPAFATSAGRGVARLTGTAIGVGAVGLLVDLARPPEPVVIALVALLVWIGFTTLAVGFGIYSAAMSGAVVLLLSIPEYDTNGLLTTSLATARIVDTLVGGALACAALWCWPGWTRRSLPQLGAELETAVNAFAAVAGHGSDAPPVRTAALRAIGARIKYETAYELALAEPRFSSADQQRAVQVLTRTAAAARSAHQIAVSPGRATPP